VPPVQEADKILEGADKEDIAFLVVGDPFGWVAAGACACHACMLGNACGAMQQLLVNGKASWVATSWRVS
jgi:hypothetical protein